MKRRILVLALLAIMATGAFAQVDFSPKGFSMAAGGGLLLDFSANNGAKGDYAGLSFYGGIRNFSFGGFGFFDGTYGELDVSFAYGSITAVTDIPGNSGKEDAGSMLQLGFSLLGKYPIDISRFTVFPLLGFDYNMVLSAKSKDGKSDDKPGDSNQFGLLFGGGLDFPLTDALFLRGEVLFHIRFASKDMKDVADFFKSDGLINTDTTIGMGPRIKIGVGYKIGGFGGSKSSSSLKEE